MRILLLLAMAVGSSLIGSNCGGSGVGDPCVPEDEYLTTFSGFAVGEVNVESRSFQCLTRVCLVNHFQGRVSCPFGQKEDTYDEPEWLEDHPGCGPIKNSGRAKCAARNEADPGEIPRFVCDDTSNGQCPTYTGSLCGEATCAPGGEEHKKACRVPDRDGSELEDRIQVSVEAQLVDRKAEDTVYCSCRCAGPDPSARYCSCPSGFACEPLVDDLGLGAKGQLAGSYCIREGTRYDASTPATRPCTAGECGEKVERFEGGMAVPVARNNGNTCEASGTICHDDIYCCDAPEPGSDPGKPWEVGRRKCSDVGVTGQLNNGESVRYCP